MSLDPNSFFIHSGQEWTGPTLVVTDYWNDDLRNLMVSKSIYYLRLSRSVGWEDHDLEFLKNLDFLKGVEIYADDIKDVSALVHLKSLEHLSLDCKLNIEVDVSQFKNLSSLYFKWNKKVLNWFNVPSLERLNVVNYPFESLEVFSNLTTLRELLLTSTKLQTLKGIGYLKSLKLLDLYRCTKLYSLESLGSLKKLEKIVLDNCKRIEDLSECVGLENLKAFLIIDCKEIQSIEPLKNCLALNRIYMAGNTTIIDGDFNLIVDLPNLRKFIFVEKKHYNYQEKEIKEILSIKD